MTTSSYGAASAAAAIAFPPPANVQVIAPATLIGGYTFDAMYDGITFRVVVPEGGVIKGQRFIVPFVPPTDASSSSSSSSRAAGDEGTDDDHERDDHRRRRGVNPPRGIWRDGLCDCFRFGPFHPHLLFALFLKPILMGQLLTRMKMTWIGRRTNASEGGRMYHGESNNPNDSRIEVDDRWRCAMRDVMIITALFIVLATATSTAANDDDDDENDDYSTKISPEYRRDVTSDTGIDDVKYAINSFASAVYGSYLIYVTMQLRAVMRRAYSIPEERCLCMYEACPLGNHDPRDGICGTDDDDDGARWCTSGVAVGWEDVCCSLCCQLCALAQMARHTVDYGERDAACCNSSGVADWDDDEAYVGVEYGHVGEGSVLVV